MTTFEHRFHDALEAGDFEAPIVIGALASGSPNPQLLVACHALERGLFARARRAIEAGVARSLPHAPSRLVAGVLWFVSHAYQRAFDQYAALATVPGHVGRNARLLGLRGANALGWDQDARSWLDGCLAAQPRDAQLHGERVRLALRGGDVEGARRAAEHAREIAPASATLHMQIAVLAADRRDDEEALVAAEKALELAPVAARVRYLRGAADVAIQIGDFARAMAWLQAACDEEPTDADAPSRLAELAAWRDDRATSRAHAESALCRSPEHTGALRVLAALHVLAGERTTAEALLVRVVELDPNDGEAHLWRAEIAYREGRREDAEEHLHRSTSRAPGHRPAAWMVRLLLVLNDPTTLDETGRVPAARFEEIAAALTELAPLLGPRALSTRRREDVAAALEAALVALRGNRSAQPTHVIDGRLVRLRARGGCRFDARAALQRLRVVPPAACLAALDDVVAKYPGSSLPLCHRGELNLWLGDLESARRDLEAAIATNIGTRWAYMGLSTLALLANDPTAALAINAEGIARMRNTEGPGVFLFRGEAHRLAGRFEEAVAELERAVVLHPGRTSAVVNLALAYGALGRHEDEIALFRRLVLRTAEGLLSDAAAELDQPLLGDGEWVPDAAARTAILTRALAMMKGNRGSSLVTYFRGDRLRTVRPPTARDEPHAQDAAHLAEAKRNLWQLWRSSQAR